MYMSDKYDLMKKLENIFSYVKIGNRSHKVLNDGINIINELLEKGFINGKQQEELYFKLLFLI